MVRSIMAVVAVVAASGCGGGSPFDYVPASGRLTYEDGQPIPAAGIRLQFFVQDVAPVDGAHPKPAAAHLDAQGNFTCVTSYRYGDGLIPGRHKISIDYAADATGKLLVPREYAHAASTPLEVVIDGDSAATLVLKTPRPR